MSHVRFLIDENLRLSTVAALLRVEPTLDVHRIGQLDMPLFGTSDTEILRFREMSERLLVTLDRASMPVHIAKLLDTGGHTAGVLLVTSGCSFQQLLEDLLLIWSCSEAEDWHDSLHYLPF